MLRKYLITSVLLLTLLCAGVLLGSVCMYNDYEVMSYNIDNDIELYNYESNIDIETAKNTDYVYLGGMPLGIDVKSKGLIIMSKGEVITDKGAITPCKDIDIKAGDRLLSIDDELLSSEVDVHNAIKDKESVILKIEHDDIIREYVVKPAIDSLTRDTRLGLWLKDGVTGIGTMTYILPNRRYGALGHPIEMGKSYKRGNIYNAVINGCIKGERGKAGELNGIITSGRPLGTIDKNTDYGIFGTYIGDLTQFDKIEVAHRNEVKNGRAYIMTTIDGITPKKYAIEIIKHNYQPKSDIKGMVIRIIDKQLLDATNGILQGMSGSPIIQNNKLIGAVTHVFINDPTKGFGVYCDFMLSN